MCSCSTGVMLFQKSRAWLKWSSYDAGASRTLLPWATTTGRSVKGRSSAPAWNGHPPSNEFGLYGAMPACTPCWWNPSRSMSLTGACGRLIGICEKFGPPSRVSWVSTYENNRAWSSGSSVTSIPGTRLPTWKATCSVSAKKLVGLPLSVSMPTGCTGASSSGTNLVGSSRSIPSNIWSGSSGMTCTPSSQAG